MKRGDGGVMMKTGELWVSLCPHVSCRSGEKGLIEWLKNLFGLPLSSRLLRPDGVVNNPLKVLHNLSPIIIGCRVIFEMLLSLGCLHLSPWFVHPFSSSPLSFSALSLLLFFWFILTGVPSPSLHRITFCHLPFQSKWLYIGTERGNIHIVNVESFTLSGYVIMWNKAIELWVLLPTCHPLMLPPTL